MWAGAMALQPTECSRIATTQADTIPFATLHVALEVMDNFTQRLIVKPFMWIAAVCHLHWVQMWRVVLRVFFQFGNVRIQPTTSPMTMVMELLERTPVTHTLPVACTPYAWLHVVWMPMERLLIVSPSVKLLQWIVVATRWISNGTFSTMKIVRLVHASIQARTQTNTAHYGIGAMEPADGTRLTSALCILIYVRVAFMIYAWLFTAVMWQHLHRPVQQASLFVKL